MFLRRKSTPQILMDNSPLSTYVLIDVLQMYRPVAANIEVSQISLYEEARIISF